MVILVFLLSSEPSQPRHNDTIIKGASLSEPVLELTDAVAPAAIPEDGPPPASAPQPPSVTSPPPPSPPTVQQAPALVSDGAACASRQSLSALTSAVARPVGETTLDGLARELLRPMLKEWLDAHLPVIVENMVAREIARITTPEG